MLRACELAGVPAVELRAVSNSPGRGGPRRAGASTTPSPRSPTALHATRRRLGTVLVRAVRRCTRASPSGTVDDEDSAHDPRPRALVSVWSGALRGRAAACASAAARLCRLGAPRLAPPQLAACRRGGRRRSPSRATIPSAVDGRAPSSEHRPAALPPAERTVGQLVAESIQLLRRPLLAGAATRARVRRRRRRDACIGASACRRSILWAFAPVFSAAYVRARRVAEQRPGPGRRSRQRCSSSCPFPVLVRLYVLPGPRLARPLRVGGAGGRGGGARRSRRVSAAAGSSRAPTRPCDRGPRHARARLLRLALRSSRPHPRVRRAGPDGRGRCSPTSCSRRSSSSARAALPRPGGAGRLGSRRPCRSTSCSRGSPSRACRRSRATRPGCRRSTATSRSSGRRCSTSGRRSGEFDFVNVVEAPDTATIAKVSVALGARGSTRIQTLPALCDRRVRPDDPVASPATATRRTVTPQAVPVANSSSGRPGQPAEEVRLGIVRRAAVDGRVERPARAARASPRAASSARRSASSAAGPSM